MLSYFVIFDQVHVWSEIAGDVYVISVYPFSFYCVIKREVPGVYVLLPVLIDAHAQEWIICNFDACHDSL